MSASTPTVRRPRFDADDPYDVAWQKRLPEFAMAANAVSMMMPHVEPYVVRSVRSVIADLPPELAAEAEVYAAQEASHHGQHRRYNRHIEARYPAMTRVDRALASTFGFIERRGSTDFSLAFAAGAETVAYAIARWVADKRTTVLFGAEGPAAELFIWHLAEEVEHKTVAFDVFADRSGSRWRFGIGMLASLGTLALYTVIGTLVMLVSSGRILNPLSWLRLVGWCLTFLFELLPTMAMALIGGHHPSQLVDPLFYTVWLTELDGPPEVPRSEPESGEVGASLLP